METSSIEDQIGQAIQQYINEKNEILVLAEKEVGAHHPEHIAGLRQQLHEKRQAHEQTRIALRNLKITHQRKLVQRLEAINLELECSAGMLDDVELTSLAESIEKKIATIEEEVKTIYAV